MNKKMCTYGGDLIRVLPPQVKLYVLCNLQVLVATKNKTTTIWSRSLPCFRLRCGECYPNTEGKTNATVSYQATSPPSTLKAHGVTFHCWSTFCCASTVISFLLLTHLFSDLRGHLLWRALTPRNGARLPCSALARHLFVRVREL